MGQYKVGLSDEAKRDLGRISSYILNELKAPQASEAVLADLENAVASLCFSPERIPLAREDIWKKQGVHAMVVRKYLIYFQMDESNHRVNVIRIIYGRRDQAAQAENILPR
ncbi:MAG: type II toxin-antitoxin system RelE/ParE family toxin [Schwartzia sp.]|nr:type II toxin-antitoxin system RelE/ParE family toxin [Schwartzia sp. (in: firmicutes)]